MAPVAAERAEGLIELAVKPKHQTDRLFYCPGVYWEHNKCGGGWLEVYLDLVLLLNFLVDFLLLLGTNRLSGFPLSPGRCALAAALGGVYAAGCLVPGFRFLGSALWRSVSLALMAVLAFGLDKSTWKRGGVFVILIMAMGGMAMSLGKGDLPALLLSALGLWLLCGWAFGGTIGGREYVSVQITHAGRQVCLTALRDSGNTLRDPISGEPVLVISAEAARDLTGLEREQLACPLETLSRRPVPGLRLIPYQAVGLSGGLLLAMRMQEVRIGQRKQSAVVAFAPEGLGKSERYQALTGGVL